MHTSIFQPQVLGGMLVCASHLRIGEGCRGFNAACPLDCASPEFNPACHLGLGSHVRVVDTSASHGCSTGTPGPGVSQLHFPRESSAHSLGCGFREIQSEGREEKGVEMTL
jgi:hypothetical protein